LKPKVYYIKYSNT